MKAELEQLIALQNIDTTLRKLQSDIETFPERRAEIEKEFDQRASEISAIDNERIEAKSEHTRLETEAVEQRARIERADRNLMSSQNEHEYTSALREADAARKMVSQLETQILEKMGTIEQAESSLSEREPELQKLRAEMEERLKEFDEQSSRETGQMDALRAERDRLMKTLPKNLSAMYNRISSRIRNGIAVAEARNGSCTACFMALRPQVMSQVRRGDELIVCENCIRILYYASKDTAPERAAAPASHLAAN